MRRKSRPLARRERNGLEGTDERNNGKRCKKALGRERRELIRDYEPLRKATRKQLENCRVDCDGVWFDDLDEGLELSGFFSPKKTNPIGRVFWLFPELNASAFARRLGIPQPLFAAYVNGTKKPSSARKKLIDEELRRIGRELLKTVA